MLEKIAEAINYIYYDNASIVAILIVVCTMVLTVSGAVAYFNRRDSK
jgi:hypothetical protein